MYLRSGIDGQYVQLGSRGCKIWLLLVCKWVWVWCVGLTVSSGWGLERFARIGEGSRHNFGRTLVCNSSSKESRACEIPGLTEARVRLRSSVLYLCWTKRGRLGWRSWSHVKTTKLSREGDSSSSASGVAL